MAILLKKLTVVGLPHTWPAGAMPPNFPSSTKRYNIDMAEVLLLVGLLTTPTLASGASFAEFWAYVRYISAWQACPSLALTPEFTELDAHQKTILSDDIGMGLPLHWLIRRLKLIGICDGRYFIERHLSTYRGSYTGKAVKHGPGKSPDFICLSRDGRFHVIECKGTQNSLVYRDRQIGLPLAKGLHGGRAQKQTVTFPTGVAGERLVCGTFISDDPKQPSHLKIIDPEESPLLAINEDEAPMAVDPIIRGILAKVLRASGFPLTANLVAFPEGRPRGIEGERYVFAPAAERADRLREAKEEMASRPYIEDLTDERGLLFGRRTLVELPAPLLMNTKRVRQIELRQGVTPRLISDGAAAAIEERIIRRNDDPGILQAVKFETNENESVMSIGKFFRSTLRLIY